MPSTTSLDSFNASPGVDDLDTTTISVTTHRNITGRRKGVNRLRLHFLLDRSKVNHTLTSNVSKCQRRKSGRGWCGSDLLWWKKWQQEWRRESRWVREQQRLESRKW